jgi:hypothetical protein
MRLLGVVQSSLPKLAWVADVDRTSGIVRLHHGSSVEVREDFFIEGVWNGPFQGGAFGETDCVFGTGGILSDASIRFVTSASTVDCLYYAESAVSITVSNSLPLILAYRDDALDPRCQEFPNICDSFLDGIDEYRRDIPTVKGAIRRQMYRNLDVFRDRVSESDKRMPPKFESFEDYRNYRRDNYALIAANARDTSRTQQLEIWSTQSKGYDTTSINAMASIYGLDKVFTVTTAKSKSHLVHNDEGKSPDDDGTELCNALGLKCIPINRRAFTESFDEEYLYYCARHHNQDVNLKEINRHITNPGVLLTGVHGEILCANDPFVDPPLMMDSTIKRLDVAGHGLAELRLVVGFIQLPVPFIGARRKADIVKVTESAAMDPWRLRNGYDRPIARRLAEEAGVPRHMFGQSKMGSVVIFHLPSIPYGKKLRREFFQYLANEKIMGRSSTMMWPIVRWVNSILMLKSEHRFALVHYTERVISKIRRRQFQFKLLWSHLEGALFCFCVNRAAEMYQRSLSQFPKQRRARKLTSSHLYKPRRHDAIASH